MNAIHDHPRRHSITVREYFRMGEAHVFAHDARLELMEGEIVEMAPIGSAHAAVVDTLATLLREAAPGALVRVQNPLVLGERSVPQPDVVLLRPRADQYYNSHPVAADALLVVEVSDSTLAYDLEVKRPIYARAGVAELWIVDIDRRELHVFCEPGLGYPIHRVLTVSDNAAVAALGGVGFAASTLFPDCNAARSDRDWRDATGGSSRRRGERRNVEGTSVCMWSQTRAKFLRTRRYLFTNPSMVASKE
jgi:Uma2 family endonuclease